MNGKPNALMLSLPWLHVDCCVMPNLWAYLKCHKLDSFFSFPVAPPPPPPFLHCLSGACEKEKKEDILEVT